MILLFVHGWSVTDTNTYGKLPEALSTISSEIGLNLQIKHIFLGRYISFHNEITVKDIARAFEQARKDIIGEEKFSCITHSTGGPVMRTWVNSYYGVNNLGNCPLKHLVMLAPANHGSALAQLGKKRVGRFKAWLSGAETGIGVLNWLELASSKQWQLNIDWLQAQQLQTNFYPFVITGENIDHKLYDHLNSYTGEKGSDGVVRVAAANMNYRHIKLIQDYTTIIRKRPLTYGLKTENNSLQFSPPTPFCVLPNTSHSGKKMGIMRSITRENFTEKPVINKILECLQVENIQQYKTVETNMKNYTTIIQEQSAEVDRYGIIMFNIHDNQGNSIDDYDLLLLAGNNYSPDKLPKGFFIDRQKNSLNNNLTYYVNISKLRSHAKKLGFRITAKPEQKKAFSFYDVVEFRSEQIDICELLIPNQTLLIDIMIDRQVDKNVFRFDKASKKRVNFKRIKPSGSIIQNN